ERIDQMEKKCKCKGSQSVSQEGKKFEGDKVHGISLNWSPIHTGDCTLTNAVLTLYSNGTATFSATFDSSAPSVMTGDTWHAVITVRAAGGAAIVTLPQIDSPTIWPFQTAKSWNANWGGQVFPEIKNGFGRIYDAMMYSSC